MEPTFFATPEKFRAWLAKNHASKVELLVGFHKVESGTPSITWPQSVDEALCFGWIDGVRKRVDEVSYTIRFTPRRATSKWSTVNIRRVAELEKLGRMQAAGRAVFDKRSKAKSSTYSYEQRFSARLEPAHAKRLRANSKAWKFFSSQAPSYQRACIHWITSAAQPATREKRLARLIATSAAGSRVY